jgi:hypothetical protein
VPPLTVGKGYGNLNHIRALTGALISLARATMYCFASWSPPRCPILKKIFNQERPDRTIVRGHRRGISFSGKRSMLFRLGMPSIGALASAASRLSSQQRNLAGASAEFSLRHGLFCSRTGRATSSPD